MFAKYSTLSPNGQRLARVLASFVVISLILIACLILLVSQHRAEYEKLGSWHGEDTRVVMYTTSTCPNCQNARVYFAQNNIEFKEFNIEHSTDYHQRFVELAGSGTPLMYVDKKRMDGFTPSQFEQLYLP